MRHRDACEGPLGLEGPHGPQDQIFPALPADDLQAAAADFCRNAIPSASSPQGTVPAGCWVTLNGGV